MRDGKSKARRDRFTKWVRQFGRNKVDPFKARTNTTVIPTTLIPSEILMTRAANAEPLSLTIVSSAIKPDRPRANTSDHAPIFNCALGALGAGQCIASATSSRSAQVPAPMQVLDPEQASPSEHASVVEPDPGFGSDYDCGGLPESRLSQSGTNSMIGSMSITDEDPAVMSLWDKAYQALRAEDEKLVDAFEEGLLSLSAWDSARSSGMDGSERHKRIQSLAREKLSSLSKQQVRLSVLGKDLVVREQLKKAVKLILRFKELVTTAVSGNQGAAIAWSGALIGLQMLSTSFQQDEDALDGFEYLSHLLIRFELIERTLFSREPDEAETELVGIVHDNMITLYTIVFRYEIDLLRHYSRGRAGRFLRDFVGLVGWQEYRTDIKKLDEKITQHIESLGANRILERLSSVQRDLEEVEIEVEKTREEVERLQKDFLLDKLDRVFVGDAVFFLESSLEGQSPRCIDGTQGSTLKEIQDWYNDDKGEAVFWLSSMSGTGKSTIARTVAAALTLGTNLSDNGEAPTGIFLGGTFFFRQGQQNRSTPKGLCVTLAKCLAMGRPSLRSLVADTLKNLNIDSGLQILWDSLILEPLSAFGALSGTKSRMRLVIILDALDECDFESVGGVQRLFQLLVQPMRQGGRLIQLRYLVTSRLERSIREAFKGLSQNQQSQIRRYEMQKVQTHEGFEFNAENDVTLFFRNELSRIARERPHEISRSSEWAGDNLEDIIRKLSHKSEGLFIYASTCCRFLDDPKARDRLQNIFDDDNDEKSPQGSLFAMYGKILTSSVTSWTRKERQELRHILGHLAVLVETVSISVLAQLLPSLGSERNLHLRNRLADLHSVIDIPNEDDSPIFLLHASFRNFLLDEQTRMHHPQFSVDAGAMHFAMFKQCLEILQQHLQQPDICKVVLPGFMAHQLSKTQVQEHIPLQLQYACRHWVSHLEHSNTTASGADMVYQLLTTKVLYWLEALAWMREIPASVQMILKLQSLFPKTAEAQGNVSEVDSSGLPASLYDAYRFLLRNRYIMERAPLQIYSSALIFAPSKSIVRRTFGESHIPAWILKPPNVAEQWSSELFVLESHSYMRQVNKIKIPLNKDIIASTSRKLICIWDLITGEEMSRLKVHSTVIDMDMSSDGTILVCVLWEDSYPDEYEMNVVTLAVPGRCVNLGQHCGARKVSISPDGRFVASASPEQGTPILMLWDVATKQLLRQVAESCTGWWGEIRFSPCGDRFAYARNNIIHIWNAHDNIAHIELVLDKSLEGFSWKGDGAELITSHSPGGVTCLRPEDWHTCSWDLSTMKRTTSHSFGARFTSFLSQLVTPDGDVLVLGSIESNGRNDLQIWNLTTDEEVARLRRNDEDGIQGREFAYAARRGILALEIDNGLIRVHNLASQRYAASIHPDLQSSCIVDGVDVSPNEDVLLTHNSNIMSHEDNTKAWHVAKWTARRIHDLSHMEFVMESSNGQYLAFAAEGCVWISELSHNDNIHKFEGFQNIIFSSDSSLVAVQSSKTVNVIELGCMETIKELSLAHEKEWPEIFFMNNSHTIGWITPYEGCYRGALHLYDLVKDSEAVHPLACDIDLENPAISSPDGRYILFHAMRRNYVWDVSTSSLKARATTSDAYPFGCSHGVFSPDSQYFADILWDCSGNFRHAFINVWQSSTVDHVAQLGPISWPFLPSRMNVAISSNNTLLVAYFSSGDSNRFSFWNIATQQDLGQCRETRWSASFDDDVLGTLNISFSDTCPHINTDEGILLLPIFHSRFSALHRESDNCIHLWVRGEWLGQGTEELLWLPGAYRATRVTSGDKLVPIGGVDGRVSFLDMDHQQTPVAAESKQGRCVHRPLCD